MPDRSPGSRTTNPFQDSQVPSRSSAPVVPARSPVPDRVLNEAHTVAGQRRIHTCFPCIQHENEAPASHEEAPGARLRPETLTGWRLGTQFRPCSPAGQPVRGAADCGSAERPGWVRRLPAPLSQRVPHPQAQAAGAERAGSALRCSARSGAEQPQAAVRKSEPEAKDEREARCGAAGDPGQGSPSGERLIVEAQNGPVGGVDLELS